MKLFYQIVFVSANTEHYSPIIYLYKSDAEKFASRSVGVLGITSYRIVELRCYDL